MALEDRRDPAEGRVVAEGLQTHEGGDRPGGQVAPESADPKPSGRWGRGAVGLPPSVGGMGEPQRQPDERDEHPQRHRHPPADVQEMLEGDRQPGGHTTADEQRHRVERGHQHPGVRKVGLDHARDDDVADRDRRADDRRAGEQRRRRGEQAHQTPGGEATEDEREGRAASKPADQARACERANAEAEHRDRGEQAAGGRAETGAATDLAQHRRHGRDCEAQVDRHEHERRRGRPLRPPHRAGLTQRSGRPG